VNNEKGSLLEIGKYLYPLFFSSLNYSFYIDHNPYFRKMIDRFIFGLHSLYLHQILRYNHLVKQKNSLLKKLGKPIHVSELDSWNKLLSATGFEIVNKRMNFITNLNNEIADSFTPDLGIEYQPALIAQGGISESSFFNDLCQVKNSEIQCRRSLLGPHRDRFAITASGKKLQLFSSGEEKKYLLMVYLAFINMFYREQNDHPVFLIDDYDATMDEKNLNFVIDHFPLMQIIATAVTRNGKFENLFELGKEN